MRWRGCGRGLVAVATLTLAACGGDDGVGTPVTGIYTPLAPGSAELAPDDLAGETFFDHPWPSDFRRRDDGTPVFRGFPNPRMVPLVTVYVDTLDDGLVDGFSTVAGGYLRFDAALDPASLPTERDSLRADAAVQLIDVDPASPTYLARTPIRTHFRGAGGIYVSPTTLRWVPSFGYPLRPATRYALVVTDAVKSGDGGPASAAPALAEIVGAAPPTSSEAAAAAAALADDVASLASLGIGAERIVHLAVFTTADPLAETLEMARHVREEVPAPDFVAREPWQVQVQSKRVEYRSRYGPSPNYQEGDIPFADVEDGGNLYRPDGELAVFDMFDLRFSLSVPAECDMPEAGYPMVLYAHGTGGNYRSYIDYANDLADQCIAMMGVDQIFHGDRPGAPDDPADLNVLFFNFENPIAARNNTRQSAIDEVQRARLFTETQAVIPAHVSHTGEPIRFDPEKVMFFGHSQGGLNGPLYLAIDDSARGAVLSGSGAIITVTLLEKTAPAPSIADLLPTIFLNLFDDESDEIDVFHPALMLAQTGVDVIDPINYARLIALEPRPGFLPKSILMTEGIAPDGSGDNFTPPTGTEAQAVAMGLPLMTPAIRPYPQLQLGAGSTAIPPEGLSGNLAGGLASGVLAQWLPAAGSDGHFVVFDVPEARAQVAGFLAALADDPVGKVPAP